MNFLKIVLEARSINQSNLKLNIKKNGSVSKTVARGLVETLEISTIYLSKYRVVSKSW